MYLCYSVLWKLWKGIGKEGEKWKEVEKEEEQEIMGRRMVQENGDNGQSGQKGRFSIEVVGSNPLKRPFLYFEIQGQNSKI
ncbi:MAG: hypothetical protein EZS28_021705 [Streblomastix strix]|uniref:Uncharacterized protein n=1 Tax=Streblomastix strix TaxID=222440 RepID=A0A5J4VKA7_9EUKA|nr:MAG: hypothetical protein EZS28_021705 [Streblomastix strix]